MQTQHVRELLELQYLYCCTHSYCTVLLKALTGSAVSSICPSLAIADLSLYGVIS